MTKRDWAWPGAVASLVATAILVLALYACVGPAFAQASDLDRLGASGIPLTGEVVDAVKEARQAILENKSQVEKEHGTEAEEIPDDQAPRQEGTGQEGRRQGDEEDCNEDDPASCD